MSAPIDPTRLQTAARAVGADKPQLATTLAQSGLTDSQMHLVGGFADALTLNTVNQLAADSGAQTNYSASEQDKLAGIGVQPANPKPQPTADSRSWLEKATAGVAGVLSNTGNFLLHNPVTGAIEDVGNWLGNAAHMPFRMIVSGLDTSNDAEIDREMKADGYDPASTWDRTKFYFSQGENVYHDLSHIRDTYDTPGNTLSDGRTMTDLIVQMQRDPEGFQKAWQAMDPNDPDTAKIGAMMKSADWGKAYESVDAEHISPGRDIARVVTGFHENNAAFHVLSGVLDAAFDWYSDPTLILGKAAKTLHALDAAGRLGTDATIGQRLVNSAADNWSWLGNRRAGLQDMTDQHGIETLLRTTKGADGNQVAVTKVGKAWQSFLNDAKALREQHALANDPKLSAEQRAQAAAQRAGIYRAMQNRYGQTLMPLLDEVNGTRVIADGKATSKVFTNADLQEAADAAGRANGVEGLMVTNDGGHIVDPNGKPIEDLKDLADYLVSTNGLLRLHTGTAARRSVIMPGRLSLRSERLAAAETHTAKATAKKAVWDYGKARQIVPTDADADPLLQQLVHADGQTQTAAQAGDAQFQALQKSALTSWQSARAKADRISRRFTSLIPNVTHIDLTDASSSKLVEQVGRMYLNKGDAARLASSYALGDLSARRSILKGVIEQSMHAAGLYKSEDGTEFAQKFLGDLDGPTSESLQQFGFAGTSQIRDAATGTMKQVALYPDQLSTKVLIPSMREMNYLAAKHAVGGYARRARLGLFALGQSGGADKLMTNIKLGWIATAAGGLRNAVDEIGNFAVNGMGREVLSARAAFTKATRKMRQDRRDFSKQYLGMLKTGLNGEGPVSRELLNKRLGIQLGEAQASHGDALAELKRATDAQMKRDDLPNQLQRDLESAQQRHELAQVHGDDTEKARAKQALREAERRAANPKKELAKLQAQHDDRGILSVSDAQDQVRGTQAELKRAQGLATAIQHRIPYAFRRAADTMNDVVLGSVLGKAMSVFGKDYAVTPERVAIAQELVDHELTSVLRDGVFQSHYADDGLRVGSDEYAMDLHRAGLRARKYQFQSIYKGWGEVEADGGTGLNAMAKTLQLRFADRTSPAHSWLQTVLPMIKHNEETGRVAMTRGEWDDMLKAATSSVRSRLDDDDPAMRHFLSHAQIFRQLPDGTPVKGEAMLAQAKDEYAARVSADLVHALAARGDGDVPHINRGLLEQIFDGYHTGLGPPDRSWLANNLPPEERPKTAIGQLWGPYNPIHEPGSFPRGYTQMMTKAYGKLVTDQINALSRNPLMTALYMNARENTRGYVAHLEDAGFDSATAEEIGKRLALRQAQDEAFKHIDNPYLSSQFSLINRNFASFVRAQEDWLRRWGRTVRDNPAMIRQAQLLIHGGEAAGLVEQDDQGNAMFVYPGSGLMLNLFSKAFGIGGMKDATKVPVSGELTSQLMFLNPSLDNPVGLTATPLISLPFKALTSMVGADHALLSSSVDTMINGQLGAGRHWWEQLLPSWANRIIGGWISTDPGSSYGQAATQGLANMEAAGVLDDPNLQTPQGKARFMQQWQASTRNALVANTLFGMFAPAAPKAELGAGGGAAWRAASSTGKGTTPDWSAHIEGLHSLRDEYRKAVAQLGLDKANAWWAKVHPGELIYTDEARTQVDTHSAQAPATVRAATWMEHNADFIKVGPGGYGGQDGVAAYFIPQGQAGTTDGTYSDVAYRAQLEAGIRSYKSLDDYFDQIVLSRGMKDYFDAKDAYDQQRSELAASGNRSAISQLDAQWKDTKDQIEQNNPLLAQKLAAGAENNAARDNQIGQLVSMVRDTSPSTVKALGANRDGVVAMLQAYEDYQQGTALLGDRSSNAATKQRQLLRATYDARIQELAGGTGAQFPDLADLARGVFRLPN